jgi:hypothetical protein
MGFRGAAMRRHDGMMKTTALIFSCLAICGAGVAAPLIEEPVAELKLGSGKTFKLAMARSYSSGAVLLRHAGGAAAVKYEEFPEELRGTLAEQRKVEGATIDAGGKVLTKVSYDFPAPPEVESQAGEERVLSGQVFVSTSDAGDVKLAGVVVSVYSKEAYRAQTAWYQANPWEASRAHGLNAEMLAKAGDGPGAMKQFNAAMEMAALGWMLVAPAEFSTTTKADGKFTLKHRVDGPFFVVAHASRVVDGETQYYRWALISELIDDAENLLLFNDNME